MNTTLRFACLLAGSFVAHDAVAYGELIQDFGDGGVQEIVVDVPSQLGAAARESGAYDAIVDKQGRTVLVGDVFYDGDDEFSLQRAGVIARYGKDGSPDTTFNGGAPVTFVQGPRGFVFSNVVELDDGRLLVAGMTYDKAPVYKLNFPVVCRFQVDGSIDGSFGDGGCRTVEHAAFKPAIRSIRGFEGGSGLAVQTDGKIVLVGPVRAPQADDPRSFAVVRLDADGNVDMSFGTDDCGQPDPRCGVAFAPAQIKDLMDPWAVAIDPAHNSILIGGKFTFPGFDMVGMARMGADGEGAEIFEPTNTTEAGAYPRNLVHDIKILSDGSAILVGNVLGSDGGALVAKFDPSGTPSEGFGSGGTVLVRDMQGGDTALATAVTLQPDGKLLIGGTEDRFGLRFFRAWRIDAASGALDENFGTDGTAALLDYDPVQDVIPEKSYVSYGIAADGDEAVMVGTVDDQSQGFHDVVAMRFQGTRPALVFSDGLEE